MFVERCKIKIFINNDNLSYLSKVWEKKNRKRRGGNRNEGQKGIEYGMFL